MFGLAEVLLIFAAVWAIGGVTRRRRWKPWAFDRFGGPPWGAHAPPWGAYGASISPEELKQLREDHEHQQAVIDGLESKIAQMEERLDFTERLLMTGKREGSAAEGPGLSAARNPETPLR